MDRFVFVFLFLQVNFHKFLKFINGKNAKFKPSSSSVPRPTCMFTSDWANMFSSDLVNMFTSDLANMFTSDLAKMFASNYWVNIFSSDWTNMFTSDSANKFTSDLANMFTSDLAGMFTSELEKYKKMLWPTCSLGTLTGEYVGLLPGIWHLIPKFGSINKFLHNHN